MIERIYDHLRIVDGTERWLAQPQALPRWRAFLEDLAAIGGHVEMHDRDEYSVLAPAELAEAACGLVLLWCGPVLFRQLLPPTQAALLNVLERVPNLVVLIRPELEQLDLLEREL